MHTFRHSNSNRWCDFFRPFPWTSGLFYSSNIVLVHDWYMIRRLVVLCSEWVPPVFLTFERHGLVGSANADVGPVVGKSHGRERQTDLSSFLCFYISSMILRCTSLVFFGCIFRIFGVMMGRTIMNGGMVRVGVPRHPK